MKKSEIEALLGKTIKWRYAIDSARGSYFEKSGLVEEVIGKNLLIDGVWLYLTDLNNLEIVEA